MLGNGGFDWLRTDGLRDAITLTASHELAEAVTDPVNTGWNDDSQGTNGEVADLTNGSTVCLNGYAVERLADQNDQPMTPAGATTLEPVNFLLKGGNLYMSSGSDLSNLTGSDPLLSGKIAFLSHPGIDSHGGAMVDVVTTGGDAYEFHAVLVDGELFHSMVTLGSNVELAEAGNGVSYVLFKDGTLEEHKDGNLTMTTLPSVGTVVWMGAGTDSRGVNALMVGVRDQWGHLSGLTYEWSDSTGWQCLGDTSLGGGGDAVGNHGSNDVQTPPSSGGAGDTGRYEPWGPSNPAWWASGPHWTGDDDGPMNGYGHTPHHSFAHNQM
jgi:hypothetical protein